MPPESNVKTISRQIDLRLNLYLFRYKFISIYIIVIKLEIIRSTD